MTGNIWNPPDLDAQIGAANRQPITTTITTVKPTAIIINQTATSE